MNYNVLLSDAVSDYLKSQDRNRQKAILKHLYEMRNDPFKGNVTRLKPPLHRLYRKRIGSDRLLFSIRGEEVYLELMGDRSYIYELAKRLERNRG
jgi:mRNA-degrading endonuclease RelE of RelBE toxin-antitoxin system